MYQQLVLYKQKHNTTCVPLFYKEVPKLAAWVRLQRQHCKKKDRIDLLNSIGFEWLPIEAEPMETSNEFDDSDEIQSHTIIEGYIFHASKEVAQQKMFWPR